MSKTKTHQSYKTKNGIKCVGVTTVLSLLNKPALLYWAWDLGCKGIDYRKFADDKAAQGTLAHDMILCHLSGTQADTSDYSKNQIDAAENSFLSYLEWEKGKVIKPIMLEAQMVHEELHYGGTFDFFGEVDGVPTLIDFKTGKAIYEEMAIQLAAYSRLYDAYINYDKVIDKHLILRIGRDESEGFEVKEYSREYIETCWELFNHLLQVYWLKNKIKKK